MMGSKSIFSADTHMVSAEKTPTTIGAKTWPYNHKILISVNVKNKSALCRGFSYATSSITEGDLTCYFNQLALPALIIHPAGEMGRPVGRRRRRRRGESL